MTLIATTETQRDLATSKLGAYIASAQSRAGNALGRIMTEVPSDRLVKAAAIDFVPDHDRGRVVYRVANSETQGMHKNAMQQFAGKAEMVKLADLRKKVGKGIADSVGEAFNRPDVEDLPPGNNLWRWSNALSWVAGHSDDHETRLDLERMAGDVLRKAA